MHTFAYGPISTSSLCRANGWQAKNGLAQSWQRCQCMRYSRTGNEKDFARCVLEMQGLARLCILHPL